MAKFLPFQLAVFAQYSFYLPIFLPIIKPAAARGRTVLTEKQRTILTACFQHNPKPDALLKVNIIIS